MVNPHLQKRQRKIATSNAHITTRKKRLPTLSSHPRETAALSWNDTFAQSSNYARTTFHGQEGAPSGRRTTTSVSSTSSSYPLEGSLSSHRRGKPLDNVTLPMPIPNSENRYNLPSTLRRACSRRTTIPTTSASSSSAKKHRRAPRARPENHQCPNCHTLDSPLWRNCMIKGKLLHLCNSCGLRYKNTNIVLTVMSFITMRKPIHTTGVNVPYATTGLTGSASSMPAPRNRSIWTTTGA